MTPDEMHQANRAAWNEGAVRYEDQVERDIAFLRAGGKNLLAPELRSLHDLRSWCRRAIHLQCAGGRDTLSLWNHGAAEVVGVDISDRMIAVAQQKSQALGAPATWYRCDILDTPAALNGTANLVYTGRGALNWILDLAGWAQVVKRLLTPTGRLYVFEGHPLTWVWDQQATEFRLARSTGITLRSRSMSRKVGRRRISGSWSVRSASKRANMNGSGRWERL